MKITLLSKPGFSGNMLVRKIQEVAKSQLLNIDVFLNEHLQEADVVLLTPQRNEDLWHLSYLHIWQKSLKLK